MVEHWDVTPDIIVGGKVPGGGYAPICGIFARDGVVVPLAQQRQDLMFYTFAGHPAACAITDKVLEVLDREYLVGRATESA